MNSGDIDSENKRSALLVESDLFFSARLVSVLERAGFSVTTVSSRSNAEAALQSAPDLVLINLAAAPLGGTDFIRDAKRLSPDTKVIAYLSHTKIPAIREEALAAGADTLCANSAITMRLPDIVRKTLDGGAPREEL